MATYYIDPTWAGTKSGTFALPWSDYASLPVLSAGDVVLQKEGTTFSGHVAANASGTNGNPITYGVYNSATGTQIATTVGAATIAGIGTATYNFSTGGQSFIEVVGFRFSSITAGQYGLRLGSNSSGNTDGNAGRYCIVTDETCPAGFLIFTNLGVVGHTLDHCVSSNNSTYGILQTGSLVAGKITVTNNVCNYNGEGGFRSAFSAAILVSGTIAHNEFNYNGTIQAVTGKGIGIDVLSDTADLLTAHNDCSHNYTIGIRMASFSGTASTNQHAASFNICNNNGEHGIQVGGGGGWFVSDNVCNYNGADRGNKYGRGIEIFGGSTKPSGPGIICFNECSYTYNYGGTINNGTEGVGIGLDDYHKDVQVFGNRLISNEGNGISLNPTGAAGSSRVFGNLLVDNFASPSARAAGWADYVKAQMCLYTTENNAQIYNNTIILQSAPSCLYGVSEAAAAAGTETVVANNIFKGMRQAALKVRDGITRSNNVFYNNPKNVEINTSQSALDNGTGAITDDPVLDSVYRPQSAACKRAGTYLGGKDYYGKQFYNPPNIGAVDDVTTTPRYALRHR